METVKVRPIMHPDSPIEVRPDEAEVLRARGLLAEDKPPAPATPRRPRRAPAARKPPTPAPAPTPDPASNEGNTPS